MIDEEAILRLRYEVAETELKAAQFRLEAAHYEVTAARLKYQTNRYDGFPYRTKVGPPFQSDVPE